MPRAKKKLSTIPMAVSCLMREWLTIKSTRKIDIHPLTTAPVSKATTFFSPANKKPIQIPGNSECAMASPISDRYLKNANVTISADDELMNIMPSTTYTTLGLLKVKKSRNVFMFPVVIETETEYRNRNK